MRTLEPGTRLLEGRYTLVRELGRGGTGRVWEARRVADGVMVAIKCMPADGGGREAADREAEVAVRVRHPSIVRVLCTYEEDGWALVAMERCELSLATRVTLDGPLEPAQAASVLVPVLEALHAAHAVGVVHRDVKPANILVRADGTVALADWGSARALFGGSGATTSSAALLGTLPYLAPEVRRDIRASAAASDQYAAGITLAWLCLGQVPDDPFIEAGAARLRASLGGLAEIVLRACAWAPEDRYASAAEMAAALGAFRATGTTARAPASGGSGVRSSLPARWVSPWLSVGIVSALVVAAWLRARASAPQVPESSTAPAWAPCAVTVRDFVSTRALGPVETVAASVDDLDGDGSVDVVFSNQGAGSLSIWWGSKGHLPTVHDELSVGRVSGRVAVLDVDGDGVRDLVVPHRDDAAFSVHPGTGGRRFGPARVVPQGPAPGNADAAGPGWVVFDGDRLLLTRPTAAESWPAHFVQGAASVEPPAVFFARAVPLAAVRDALGWSLRVLAHRPEDATRVALPTAIAGVRSIVPWRDAGVDTPTALGAVVGDDLVRVDLDDAGEVRACRVAAWTLWPAVLAAIADLDADGVPDVVASSTCSGCTSNQVFARGVR